MGQRPFNLNLITFIDRQAPPDNDHIKDTINLQAAFKVDPATITIGYGYAQSENDVAGDDADQQQSYFVNAKIPIADTFFVVPEYSYYDLMDDADGEEENDTWNFGVLLRMDF